MENLLAEAWVRGLDIIIVLDLIHIIHYLWIAGYALCDKDPGATEQWVRVYLENLLTGHLRHLLAEYLEHYHTERNHQSLDNELIEPAPANANGGGQFVRRRARLGGLLSWYYREAA